MIARRRIACGHRREWLTIGACIGEHKVIAGRDSASTMRYIPDRMRAITSSDDFTSVCQRLSTSDFVAVDTEFMREQTFWPQLCLVQLADRPHRVVQVEC